MRQDYQVQDILTAEIWDEVGLSLLAKMISEFMYEEIIKPEVVEETGERTFYHLPLAKKDGKEVHYRFEAKKRLMNSYRVYTESIQVNRNDQWERALNPIQFILDIQETVGMKPLTTGHLIKEYNNTLLADAHILQKKKTSDELVDMDYGELEGEMEGHPWITYNKGRIGFDYQDYLAYSPEQKKQVKLSWVAVDKKYATFHSVSEVHYETLLREELGEGQYHSFIEHLESEGLDASTYFFLPIHEWQWNNVIIQYFPGDIAEKRIVPLGAGEDNYLPQQSIRTFVNTSDKQKHHVKLPMSILNTLVYRGLPAERTVVAPIITDYIHRIREQDLFLKEECRIILPGEVASMNYNHPYYSTLEGAPYQYLEMLGSIWRESIYSFLEEDEHAITLASLLYVDDAGKPFVASLIEKSGLTVEQWTKKLFDVTLPPLLHFLYKYGTVFSPHGQNTVVILKDHVPHRLAMKDFVDDVNISGEALPELLNLPEELKPVLRSEGADGLCQFIFTGLFVCHFRYLADIIDVYYAYDEEQFWQLLRETILAYHKRFPELEDRFRLFDLLQPTFTKLCLNRNRMIDYGYEDDDDRPHASEFGYVRNPLYKD
ncbi:IucA/IucC family siderophore biosynthesis protein [Alkalihalophilus lindianensis]|uniref:IucA/IucC family siderophore biosynthesis protein n=1 Tax=Alkalihalophilus lindianensis TaxID=1630542 RepID=A0ABU3X4W3_9BACI|nr:IucA/IucC family siderophore biosynthesis protein [Alkalihalophilus lindianensis]MDV2682921.1 IucA/IucC family siderophore biosynthesis protein [Alkalihalophilus lindianensis]